MNDRTGYTEAVTEKMTRERLDIVLVTASFPASTSPTTVCLPLILFCRTFGSSSCSFVKRQTVLSVDTKSDNATCLP